MKKLIQKILSVLNIKHDLTLKFISLVLAIFFWIFVMDKENPIVTRTFYNIPVSYAGEVKDGLVISSAPKYYSNIEVSGRRNSVLATKSDAFDLRIDLSVLNDGKNEAEIEYIPNFNDISIDRVSPSVVSVVLEKIIRTEKPVYYALTSSFPDSLAKSEVSIEPSQVTITGPRSLVAAVVSLTANVDAASIADSAAFEVELIPVNSLGERVEGVTPEVSVATVQVKSVREKSVPVVYEYEDKTGENLEFMRFIVSSGTAVIQGSPRVIDGIESLKTEKVVIESLETAAGTFVFVPVEGVTILNADQFKYRAEYTEYIETDFPYPVTGIRLDGLADGYEVRFGDLSELTVRIRCEQQTAERLNAKDFRLSLDLTGLEEGEHLLKPDLHYPTGEKLSCRLLPEESVKVTIVKTTQE